MQAGTSSSLRQLPTQMIVLLHCCSQKTASECEPCIYSWGHQRSGDRLSQTIKRQVRLAPGRPALLSKRQHGGTGEHLMFTAQRVSGVDR